MSTWDKLLASKPVLVCAVPLKKPSFYYLPTSCEAVELRLDYMDNLGLTQEVKRVIEDYVSHYPTIVTVREREEGGGRAVSPEVKYGILEFSKGVGAVPDVEVDLLVKYPDMYGDVAEGSILSRHVFSRDVSAYDLAVKDLDTARRFKALIYKVFSINDNDFLNLLRLLNVSDINVAVIPRNPTYRAISIMMGSALMYCSVRGKTGPGQLSIGLCNKVKLLKNSLSMFNRE
ncbi:type I 3-dehydroquinate dehydratase [Vulcanisaeta distributa]|uniref:3-dehydroquinate dehydratase n=1 Tax=Vulcanisaeta distributa (strain DSM 14429 / JCM 11212 / NBRC 100878 / IC-017) TaxID=572478 RepID=E1QT38_VULDI|nr:type I 3-dehydroquinate dehydratase [Vulcanisaeta distributa]ADN49630.1 3-dehydroquinate dehydratase, putative [Vulcanisaeta distributa DSM 14429]